MAQRHIIKIIAQISWIKLLVRFPARLTVQLKTDRSQVETKKSYDLKNGMCTVNETIEADAEALFDPISGQYEDKKIRLIIQMASTNGVIPAGSVSFNPSNKEYFEKVEYTLPLEKCPDRSAQINFFQSFQLLRKEGSGNQQSSIRAGTNILKSEVRYSSSNTNLIQGIKPRSPAARDVSGNRRITPNKAKDISPRNRYQTSVSNVYPSFQGTSRQEQNNVIASQVVQAEPFGNQASKYIDVGEKASYMKEIARLKGQVKTLQGEERWDHIIRAKEQNQALTAQLQRSRDRIRTMERRQREINLQLKESKQEAQRNKSRFLQAETLKNQGEVILADRQRTIRQLQSEKKRLNEKISDLNGQMSNLQKRVEFKESSYQEQLRKINEKYTQSQNERQKITFDYNGLLAKLEDIEKKNQNAAKEKERIYTEQRNTLNKKINQLSQQLDKLKETLADKESHLTEGNLQIKHLQKRQSEREEKLTGVESQLELNKMMLKKQLDQRKIHEKELGEAKLVQEERNNLRKRNNQLAADLSKQTEKNDRLTSELSNSQARLRQVQASLNEKNKEKDSLSSKYNTQRKELENLKKEQEKRARDMETLSVTNFNSGQKINDLMSKIQTEKRDADEMKAFYEQQLAYLVKSKEYADNEIEQLKWNVEKGRQQIQDLNNRLKASAQKILQLNQQVLISGQRVKRVQDEINQLKMTNSTVKRQLNEAEQKERTLNEQLKSRAETSYEIQKKLQSAQSDLFVCREKLKQTQSAFDERKSADQKTLKDRERSLGQRGDEVTQLQLQIMTMREENNSLSQQSTIRGNQINYLRDSLQTSKQETANRQIKLEQLREQLRVCQQQLQSSGKQNDSVSKTADDEKKANLKLRNEWETYKRDTTKALQQLLDELAKDQDGSSSVKHELLTFPDAALSALQVNAVKKRNVLLARYNASISQLRNEKALLETDLNKLKKQALQHEEQLEGQIRGEKDKLKHRNAQWQLASEEYDRRIQALQEKNLELSGQVQRSANQIKKFEEIVEQLTQEIKLGAGQKEMMRNDLKEAQERILSLKSNEIKWKASSQSKMTELSGQNESTLQKYRSNVSELEKRLAQEQRALRQKEEANKKLQTKLNQTAYEQQRAQGKNVQLQEKVTQLTEEKKELEKKVKTLEKDIKEVGSQLLAEQESLNNERVKLETVQNKLAEVHEALTESNVQVQRLRGELNMSKSTGNELEDSLKDRTEKNKQAIEKSSNEIKELKEKIINLNSAVELRDFQIGQQQISINSLRQQLTQAKQEVNKRKQENIALSEQIQQCRNQELYSSQNIQILKSEKEFLQDQNDRLKQRVSVVQEELGQAQLVAETVEIKEKEILKLKEDSESIRLERDRLANEVKGANVRSSNLTNSRLVFGSNNTEDKRRIRELQQLLESKHIDLSIQRKKILNELDREKRIMVSENAGLRQEISNLQNEFDFQRAQLVKEIESLGEDCDRLNQQLVEKTQMLLTQQGLLESAQNNQNSQQIREYLSNVKSIFQRMEKNGVDGQDVIEEMEP